VFRFVPRAFRYGVAVALAAVALLAIVAARRRRT
jgi:hypothetical protein